jgi:hypothetical protein
MAKAWNPLDHLDEVKQLASLGLSEKQISTKLNIHAEVMRYHRMHCKKFEQAIQEGLNNTIIIATQQLNSLINQGDFKAIKFFLEKKAGWGDLAITDSSSKPSFNNFNLKPTPLSEKSADVDN